MPSLDRPGGRAPVLFPHPLLRAALARTARVWVDDQGALWSRRAGEDSRLVEPGAARAAWWVVDRAQAAAGLPSSPGGWLVLTDDVAALVAVRLADWCPEPDRLDETVLRRVGVLPVVQSLGCSLRALSSPQDATERLGRLGPSTAYVLLEPPRVRLAGVVLVLVFFVLAFLSLVTVWTAPVAAAALLAAAAGTAVFRRRAPDGTAGWTCPPRSGLVGAALRDGVVGDEVVVRTRTGQEWWLPGRRAGGVTGAVVLTGPDGSPSGALLADRSGAVAVALDPRWLEQTALAELARRAGWELDHVPATGGRLPDPPRPWLLPTPARPLLPVCVLGALLSAAAHPVGIVLWAALFAALLALQRSCSERPA